MRKISFFILILAIVLVQTICFADISLTTDQKEYYFTVGEDASIPFGINSSYTNSMPATLQYSLIQGSSQGGMSYSQTSTQQHSFVISPGRSRNGITLNAADPVTYTINFDLLYQDGGKQYSANLPPLTVHFVQNSSSEKNSPDPQESTTNEVQAGQSGSSSQDPFDQMDQEMNQIREQHQQMINQMMQQSSGSQQSSAGSSGQNNLQQAVQNNQMNAQSTTLQQQLQQETVQKNKQQKEMADQVRQDQNLQDLNQQLKQAGYTQDSGSLEPQGDDKGSFTANYSRSDGEKASVQGSVQNGTVDQMTATGDDHMPVPDELAQDSRYKEQSGKLLNESYQPKSTSISINKNQTQVEQKYQTPDGKNATVHAVIKDGETQEVKTIREEIPLVSGWILGILLIILLVCLLVYLGYRYHQKRGGIVQITPVLEEIIVSDPRDDALRMLQDAESSFSAGEIKEAYSLAGRSLRLYVSGKYGSSVEGTSDEVLALLKNRGKNTNDITRLLDICTLVEFAKREGKSEEFTEIIINIRNFFDKN